MAAQDGTLVSIEGIDGAGKSSVIYGDVDYDGLRDHFPDAVLTSEPQEDQWLGKVLRRALSDKEMSDMALFFLFLAEHAQHVEDYVRPALDDGSLVITDRYIDSRYAYQTDAVAPHLNEAIIPEAEGWIRSIQEAGWSEVPDLTIILDIPVETALDRLDQRPGTEEVFEKREKLEQVRDRYHDLAARSDRYALVNGARPRDVVAAECAGLIENERTND